MLRKAGPQGRPLYTKFQLKISKHQKLRNLLISVLSKIGILQIFVDWRLERLAGFGFWRKALLLIPKKFLYTIIRLFLLTGKFAGQKSPRIKYYLLFLLRFLGLQTFAMRHLRRNTYLNQNDSNISTYSLSAGNSQIEILGESICSKQEWDTRFEDLFPDNAPPQKLPLFSEHRHQDSIVEAREEITILNPRVTILSSLYRSDKFLDSFLENLAEQTIFQELEIICVLVSPSEYELNLCRIFASRYSNVKLLISENLIGIYEAWNWGITNSKAPFITNVNADDLRRQDSIQIQVEAASQNLWADVVYQDVIYSLDRSLSWEAIEKLNFRSHLGPVSVGSLLAGFNFPHNGPLWRRELHDELGLFDANFKSAGDFDFWLRCALANKRFLKVRDTHVSYFINPEGMSTKIDGPGAMEAALIQSRALKQLEAKTYAAYLKNGFQFSKYQDLDELLTYAAIEEISNQRKKELHA